MQNIRTVFAEFIGTMLLVFIATGTIVVDQITGGAIGHVGICISVGLLITALIYSIGNVSGAHMNPAVSIGFFVARRLKLKQLICYLSAQLAGGIIGAGLVWFIFPAAKSLGTTNPSALITIQAALIIELIISFILMFVILNVSTGHFEKGIMAGAAIGGTIALLCLFAGPMTGASMNPARSFAPALVGDDLKNVWLYILAPIAGTCLAYPASKLVQGENVTKPKAQNKS